MELNHAALLGFRTRYETVFNNAFALAKPTHDKVAVVIESGRVEQVIHRWMQGIPGMREFIGSRVINNLSTAGFTIANKLWEDTVAIQKVDLERDQYKVYDPMVQRMGEVAALHPDVLVYGLLSAALASSTRAANVAYDSIAFFGAHTTRSVPFTNVTNVPLTTPALATAISEIKKRRDTQGNLLAVAGTKPLLITGPALNLTASQLANASFIVGTQPGTGLSSASSQAGATENVLKGTFDVHESAYISTDTEWHLTLQSPYLKPIVFQREFPIEMYSWEKFIAQWTMYDQFVVGVRGGYNVGLGLPEMVYSSTGDNA
jgi:phage major head subunit gpT-like protein